MKVVITGLTGNVGTAFLRRHGGDPALALTGIARRLPDEVAHGRGVEWLSCDLAAPEAPGVLAEAFHGADAVVHLAWAIHPAAAEPPMARTNTIGTRAVLDAAARAGVGHLVCASSVAAYSAAPRWQLIGEDWPCHGLPVSAYSRGKAGLEHRLDVFETGHPEITVTRIRPCAIVQRAAAGEFTRWLISSLLPESLVGSRWLPLPFWPGMRMQAVHAEDVADALHTILFRRNGGAFNLASEQVLDGDALASTIGGPRLPVPRGLVKAAAWASWRGGIQPVHPGWLRLADEAPLVETYRAREELGWYPRHDSASAIGELAAGLAGQAGMSSPPLEPHRPSGARARLAALTPGRPCRQSQA